MNVTLRQLRAFVMLARMGSFTLAAEGLFITQSALSGLIKELELVLGTRLFDRSTRRVSLTAAGESLLPRLETVLHDLDVALLSVSDASLLKTGVVRVATTQLLASTLMPALIAEFQLTNPGITVQLSDAPTDGVMGRVFAGEVEFGIGPEREPNSDITSTQLFDGPFMAVCPESHPLLKRKRWQWQDLTQYPVIALQGQFSARLAHDLRLFDPALVFRPAAELAYMPTVLSMVKAGLGVGLCIPYAADLVEGYGLKMVPLGQPEIRRSFDVFTRKGRSLSPAAQRFLTFIGPKIRAMPHLAGGSGDEASLWASL